MTYPDSAEFPPDQRPPGLHLHRHPPNLLHAWVFQQHQVWVDGWGNEYEIESMSVEYAENVIAYCRRRLGTVLWLVTGEAFYSALERLENGETEEAVRVLYELPTSKAELPEWFESLPVIAALNRRLSTADGGTTTRSSGI